MKAIVIEEFGGSEKLKLKELPIPIPNDNEVQIKVNYAGVNPVDWKIREGFLKERLPHHFPIILGWDVSGVVSQIGKNQTKFKVGDKVFAYVRKPIVQFGSYAEYVCMDANFVAHIPSDISLAEAAALPLVSLTAWQSLFDSAKLKRGESVLIHAGSGGVGSMAIQFAKEAGAIVYTTASESKHEYVKLLGADVAIDYSKENFVDAIKKHENEGVDVVFDCVGKETFKESLKVLKKGGRVVSILEHLDETEAKKLGISAYYVFVQPNGEQLKIFAELIESGAIVPPHVQEIPLEEAAKAQDYLQQGKILGKIVLKVSELTSL